MTVSKIFATIFIFFSFFLLLNAGFLIFAEAANFLSICGIATVFLTMADLAFDNYFFPFFSGEIEASDRFITLLFLGDNTYDSPGPATSS